MTASYYGSEESQPAQAQILTLPPTKFTGLWASSAGNWDTYSKDFSVVINELSHWKFLQSHLAHSIQQMLAIIIISMLIGIETQ